MDDIFAKYPHPHSPEFEQLLMAEIPKMVARHPIELKVKPLVGFFVVAHLQAALRNLPNDSISSEHVEMFARALAVAVAGDSEVIRVALEFGWHREYDTPLTKPEPGTTEP